MLERLKRLPKTLFNLRLLCNGQMLLLMRHWTYGSTRGRKVVGQDLNKVGGERSDYPRVAT
jgi:hypothetical protein